MMDKERETFEAWLFKYYPKAKELGIVYRPNENLYEDRQTQIRWIVWQAAKSQAIPDGYKVVPKEPTQEMLDAFPEVEYEDTYAGVCSMLIDNQTLKIGYKAMIEAQEQKG